MENSGLSYVIHKLWVGFRLRCPNCEQGRMFRSFFNMNPTCPECGVRFERSSGESLGGVMINLIVAELVTIGGFFLSETLFHPPLLFQIVFWISFNILLVLAFYRPSRGMWVSVAYLTGGVYRDPETDFTQSDP